MLVHLHVKNLALIDEIEVEFGPGLNILTGETGAGKSILLGSMQLILGGKTSRSMIRENAPYALVELLFQVENTKAKEALAALDIYPEDGQILMSRKIMDGRSINKINGETSTVSQMKAAAACLLDIHGQHEHQSLLYEEKQLEILDAYGREKIFPEKRGIASILLVHGGDEKHIPFRKNELLKLGYDYIALGHIHLPAELAKDRMYYAGSLEPTDKNDTGKHGYIKGEIKNGRTRTEFIPFASREYVHMEVEAGREMTGREMKEKIALAIRERGVQNIYKIILRGFRDPDMIYDTERMDSYGNIVEILDETKPAYDYEKLKKQNTGNLLGWYIESFAEAKDDSVESIALAEGVQAMLEAKGSKL